MEADESKAPFAVERIPVDNGVVTVDIPVDMCWIRTVTHYLHH